MAQIIEEVIIVKVSKLVKSSDVDAAQIANDETLENIEAIAQQLFGEGVIVEVEKA